MGVRQSRAKLGTAAVDQLSARAREGGKGGRIAGGQCLLYIVFALKWAYRVGNGRLFCSVRAPEGSESEGGLLSERLLHRSQWEILCRWVVA